MSHSIKKGVKMYPNHTGVERSEKDPRRGWPSHILGTAYADESGWYVGPDGKAPNFTEKLRLYKKKLLKLKGA